MNIHRHEYKVSQEDRLSLLNQKPIVLWFTGLSGSGKSTISNLLEETLFSKKKLTYTLDGDNIRFGLNKNLSFSDEDRKENIRRIAEVSKLFLDSGVIVLCSFISPFIEDRAMARDIIGTSNFVEIYVKTSIEICEQRDPKGLYKKVRSGDIKLFTGIYSPYESPINPQIEIDTSLETPEMAVEKILNYLQEKNYVN
jgi:adenylylsulfate kinase